MIYLPLFVYGTLRPGSKKYSLVRYQVIHGRTSRALLSGHQMYGFGYFPGIIPDVGAVMPVQGDLLWLDLTGYEDTMKRVDAYEGEGFIFNRREVVVRAGYDSHSEVAWTYLANPDILEVQPSMRIESNDWLKFAYRS